MASHPTLYAIVMAGGRGERLWPVSRTARPKYLAPVWGRRTLLDATLARVERGVPTRRAWIITEQAHASAVRRGMPARWRARVVAEPRGRNTAVCIGLGALLVQRRHPEGVCIALPADHWIPDARAFWRAARCAAAVARATDRVVALGITPRGPETAYGYIRVGTREPQWEHAGQRVFAVDRFLEKPSRQRAARLIATRRVYWNAGIFIATARRILAELRAHRPALGRALDAAAPHIGTPRQARAVRRLYASVEASSFDYAVMERTRAAALVVGPFAWDDVGSWASWLDRFPRDRAGNVVLGRHVGVGTHRTLVVNHEEHLIATLGVRDIVIVHTPDATLVCHRDDAQGVRRLLAVCRSRRALAKFL